MTTLIQHKYNLLQEPFIPVLSLDGVPRAASLLELALNAERYRELSHHDPLVVISVHRLVLAFLHRALEGPKNVEQAADWYEDGFPREKVEAYAEKWEARFDLFHPEHPFFQHPDLDEEKFLDHWSRLRASRGSFNTNFLYSYDRRDGEDSTDAIPPGEAALDLIAHQSFALGGLTKRFITSAKTSPYATSCLTLVLGDNLHQTFCLNLVSYGETMGASRDRPVWEVDPPSKKCLKAGDEDPIIGLAQSYAWPSRSIRLLPTEDGKARTMYYAEGLSPGDSPFRDPMIALTRNRKGDLYNLSYREDRALWRDLASFVPGTGEGNEPPIIDWASSLMNELDILEPLDFAAFGLVNNQAKINLVRQDQLRLPPLALKHGDIRQTLERWTESAAQESSQLGRALKVLATNLISKRRGGAAPGEVKKLVASFQADTLYWPRAEQLFWEQLRGLPRTYEVFLDQETELDEAWTQKLRRLKAGVYEDITRSLEPSAETLRAINKGYITLWRGNRS